LPTLLWFQKKLELNVGLEFHDANLIPVTSLPKKLAVGNHRNIIHDGKVSLKDKVVRKHWLLDIMPKEFTIAELHEAYKAIGVYEADGGNEAIGGIANKDRGNFHKYADKHLIKKKFIMDIGKTREGALGPPIKIYTEC
tara:strand:- start:1743 stop:2159 length:417 start_codon:yes stop_codon:yes gene_type:complete